MAETNIHLGIVPVYQNSNQFLQPFPFVADLIVTIFLNLTLSDLARSKLVNKAWKQFIDIKGIIERVCLVRLGIEQTPQKYTPKFFYYLVKKNFFKQTTYPWSEIANSYNECFCVNGNTLFWLAEKERIHSNSGSTTILRTYRMNLTNQKVVELDEATDNFSCNKDDVITTAAKTNQIFVIKADSLSITKIPYKKYAQTLLFTYDNFVVIRGINGDKDEEQEWTLFDLQGNELATSPLNVLKYEQGNIIYQYEYIKNKRANANGEILFRKIDKAQNKTIFSFFQAYAGNGYTNFAVMKQINKGDLAEVRQAQSFDYFWNLRLRAGMFEMKSISFSHSGYHYAWASRFIVRYNIYNSKLSFFDLTKEQAT